VQTNRFRHGTKLLRFRDDKNPKQCTWRELLPPRAPGDPGVNALLDTTPKASTASKPSGDRR